MALMEGQHAKGTTGERRDHGQIVGIYTATDKGLPVLPRERAKLIAGVGIEGDRYATGLGHYRPTGG